MGNNLLDPAVKYAEDMRRDGLAEPRIYFRPESEPRAPNDPVDQAKQYVNRRWVQNLVPVRTECLICHKQSDIVYLPIGTICFGNLRMLRRGNSHNKDIDITREAIDAFARLGWKFQLKRSYCPGCKGLGHI